MEKEKELVAGLTQSHVNAISGVLYFYERHLWNFATPSAKRTRNLTEIHLLLIKLQLLASSKIGTFMSDEVGYMEVSFSTFITQTQERIPQSASRDEVLESCKDLCDYLVKTLR